jgi:hypothetical protein
LTVAFRGTVDPVVDRWRRLVGEVSAALGVASVDDTTRSAARPHGVHDVVGPGDAITSTVLWDPSALIRLGFRTSRCPSELADGEHTSSSSVSTRSRRCSSTTTSNASSGSSTC